MTRFVLLASVTFVTSVLAQDAGPGATGALDEAYRIIETQADTLANISKAIALYEKNIDDPSVDKKRRVDAYADLSRAYLRLGDQSQGTDAKIAAYEKGRAMAQKGTALDPKHSNALFWDLGNLAVIGRTKGIMNSLFMIGDLRKGLEHILAIDPNHHYARQTLAEIDHAVPGIAGGSDARAEKGYLEILRRDPAFTGAMMNLAQLYLDQGKKDDARTWAQKVLATKSSEPNDWRKYDEPKAKKLLKALDAP